MQHIELGNIFNGDSLPKLAWVCCVKPEQTIAIATAMAVKFEDPRTSDYDYISFASVENTDQLIQLKFVSRCIYIIVCKRGKVTKEMAMEVRQKLVLANSILVIITPFMSFCLQERPETIPPKSLSTRYVEPRATNGFDYVAYAKMNPTTIELYIDKYRNVPGDHPKELLITLLE